jgi:ribonuclease BN (tRNA processing enzyme)
MRPTVRFLGTGNAFGHGGRFQTCFLLRATGATCLIDCGASAPLALRRDGVRQPEVSHILVSHLHGDHMGGVPFLLLDAAYADARSEALVIAGPPGIGETVTRLLDLLYPGTVAKALHRVPHRFVELAPDREIDLGGLRVRALPVRHGSDLVALGVRVSADGATVAYSGDTEWTPALLDLARDADLFVCECNSWEEPVPAHLTHAELVRHAHEITARRMVLTHLGPDMLAHAHEARWTCVADGMAITL